jgi:uncharacterized membrane protein
VKTWLTVGGALAALATGVGVTIGAGWPGLGCLFAFFLSSTLLTPGGGRRNALQVAANGGVATVAAFLSHVNPIGRIAFAGALAAAAADTWSTEIGGHSSHAPRLITSGHRVERGTSGGATWLGTAGGAAGAAFVAGVATVLGVVGPRSLVAVAVAGIAGGIAD